MGFTASASPSQRPGSASLPSRNRLCDETPYAMHRFSSTPRFAFDPDAVLTQSIEEQLQRLYRGPEFDASPAARPPSASVPYRTKPARGPGDPNGLRGRYSSADLAASLPTREVFVTPSPVATTQSRRRVSSRPASAQTHAAPRRHLAAAVATSPFLASTVPDPSRSVEWRRQRRKEELVESGLEPMQNLIGLGSYFVQRPHFSYHPLYESSTGTLLPDSAAPRRTSAVAGARGERGPLYSASCLPRPSSSTPATVQARTPQCRPSSSTLFGMLPGAVVHAHAARDRTITSLGDAPSSNPARGSGVTAGASVTAAAHDSADTAGGGVRRRARGSDSHANSDSHRHSQSHNGNNSSTTSSSSQSRRGTASWTSGADTADVFFDEDLVAAQLASQPQTAPADAPPSSNEVTAAVDTAATATGPSPLTATDLLGPPATASTPATATRRRPHEKRRKSSPLASSSTADHRATAVATASAAAPPPPPTPLRQAGGSTTQAPPPSSCSTGGASPFLVEEPAGAEVRERRRMAEALVRQLLRLRLKHQYLQHNEVCPCGVCDDSRRALSAYARGRQVATQRARPPSAAAAVMRPARHSPFAQPPARHSQRPSREPLTGVPPAHYDVATAAEPARPGIELDVYDDVFRTHRRCDCCEGPARRSIDSATLMMVPAPPPTPHEHPHSQSRRRRPGQPLPSSVAHLSDRAPKEQPQPSAATLSVPFSAPTLPSHRGLHYYQQTPTPQQPSSADVASRSPVVAYEDTEGAPTYGGSAHEVHDLDGTGLLGNQGSHDELLQLLRALLPNAHQAARATAADAPPRAAAAATGAPDHDLESLLRALRAEVPMDDATYAALLRLLFGGGGGSSAIPTPLPAPTTDSQAVHSIPHLPSFAPQPQRVDVGVETTALPADPSPLHEALHAQPSESPRSTSMSSVHASVNENASSSAPERAVVSSLEAVTSTLREEPSMAALESVETAAQTDADSTGQREADFAVLLHTSVVHAQLRVLEELEASLRAGLMKEQTEEHWAALMRSITDAEAHVRRTVALEGEVERADLVRHRRYLRDRILTSEAALKVFADAIVEEDAVWHSLIADAAAAATTIAQSAAAVEALRKGVAALTESEGRGRRGIVWTEALVRHELQGTMCSYMEAFAREDVEFDEELERGALLRAYVTCVPAGPSAAGEEETTDRDDAASHTAIESPLSTRAVNADQAPLHYERTSPFYEMEDDPAGHQHGVADNTGSAVTAAVEPVPPVGAAVHAVPEVFEPAAQLPRFVTGPSTAASANETPNVTHTSPPVPVSTPASAAPPTQDNDSDEMDREDDVDRRADTTGSDDGTEYSGPVPATSSGSFARRRRVRPAGRHRNGATTAVVFDDVGELVEGDAEVRLARRIASDSSLDHSCDERQGDVAATETTAANPAPTQVLETAEAEPREGTLLSASSAADAALDGEEDNEHPHQHARGSSVQNEDDSSLPQTSSALARKGASDGAVSATESQFSSTPAALPPALVVHSMTEITMTDDGAHGGTSPTASQTGLSHNPNARRSGNAAALVAEDRMLTYFESSIDTRRFMCPLPTRSEVGSPNRPDPAGLSTDDEANEDRELTEYEVAPTTEDAEERADDGDEYVGDEVAGHESDIPTLTPAPRGAYSPPPLPRPPSPTLRKSSASTPRSPSLSSPHLRDVDVVDESADASAIVADEAVSGADEDDYERYPTHGASGKLGTAASATETAEELLLQHRGDSVEELVSPTDANNDEYPVMETEAVHDVAPGEAAVQYVVAEHPDGIAAVLSSLKAKHPLHYPERHEEEEAEVDEGDAGDVSLGEQSPSAAQDDRELDAASTGTDGANAVETDRGVASRPPFGYCESAGSEALSVGTRMVRGRCWEENGTAAWRPSDGDGATQQQGQHSTADVHGDDASPEALDGRPETPEFVRHLLALQRGVAQPGVVATPAAAGQHDAGEHRMAQHAAPPTTATRESTVTPVAPLARSYRSDGDEYDEGENTRRSYESSSRSAATEDHDGHNDGADGPLRRASEDEESEVGQARLVKARHAMQTARPSQPTQPQFPWETTSSRLAPAPASASAMPAEPVSPPAPRAHGGQESDTHAASALVALRDLDGEERGGTSGAPNRFGGLAVRVPSPHPRALAQDSGEYLLDEEEDEEEGEEGRAVMASVLDDTRHLHTMPNASLESEELRCAPLRIGEPLLLIDSFTGGKIS